MSEVISFIREFPLLVSLIAGAAAMFPAGYLIRSLGECGGKLGVTLQMDSPFFCSVLMFVLNLAGIGLIVFSVAATRGDWTGWFIAFECCLVVAAMIWFMNPHLHRKE